MKDCKAMETLINRRSASIFDRIEIYTNEKFLLNAAVQNMLLWPPSESATTCEKTPLELTIVSL
jgi:hypothetical protein